MAGIDDREFHKTAPVPSTGRPSIYDCREPNVNLGAFLDEHLPRLRGARVLDVGSAAGPYVPATLECARELVALDIAVGRVASVDERAARVCADVEALPFRNGIFDAAMAMHMLYHVPDIRAAACELRRVLADGGVLYAFTNSERAQWELAELLDRNGCDPSAGGDFGSLRFSNENGAELLRAGFDDVELLELTDSTLVVHDAEQIVDEIERNRYLYEPGLRDGVTWDELIDAIRRDAQAIIERDGAFVMSENHGLFTCRD
jgi:SAM-dependent methyltransferase